MNVLIIDIDSVIPNLALKKIEKFHKDKGDAIVCNNELFRDWADKIYVSCIFTKNKHKCEEWEGIAEIGGSGYDLHKKLPKEIDDIKPKINWGFTTRGCIRKCPFCIVPQKEGVMQIVGDIYDLWDGKSREITIMDNNILALQSHFKSICSQIRKEKLIVDFNQGLDIRLLNDGLIDELKSIRHKEYKFSWDNDDDMEDRLKWVFSILGRCTIFVICGFLEYEKVLLKFETIKKCGHNGYCMRHESIYDEPRYIELARWVNQHNVFQKMTLEQFKENKNYRQFA